jgi:hypothetical protein
LPDHIDNNHSPRPFRADTPDAAKLPVLLALLDDTDMRVRWWASEKLGQVKGDGVPATVAALVRLLQAEEPADRFIGAMALGQHGALDRAALPALFTLRGDKTRVPWFSMTLGDLADGQIRRIDPTALPKGTNGPTAGETPQSCEFVNRRGTGPGDVRRHPGNLDPRPDGLTVAVGCSDRSLRFLHVCYIEGRKRV